VVDFVHFAFGDPFPAATRRDVSEHQYGMNGEPTATVHRHWRDGAANLIYIA
jgi:hypothetical protein